MTDLDSRVAAVSDGLSVVRKKSWPTMVEVLGFDEGEVSFRVKEREPSDITVHVVVVLTCDGNTTRREESHLFPADMPSEKIVDEAYGWAIGVASSTAIERVRNYDSRLMDEDDY